MAAGMTTIDTAMYGSNKPAWHRHPNSRVVEGQPDGDRAIEISGLGWLVEKQPLFGSDGNFESPLYAPVPGFFSTVRTDLPFDDSRRFLGVVQGRYEVVQNKEVVKMLEAICGEGGGKFETLGSLWGGRTCYATVTLPNALTIQDDVVNLYLVGKWGHDGLCGIEACTTPVRAVCANTVRAAFAGAKATTSIRHTSGARESIEEARRILGLSKEYIKRVGDVFFSMSEKEVDDRFVEAYLKALFPDPPKKEKAKEDNRTGRAESFRVAIENLWNGKQKGADMKAVKGTAWGLWNATTEWIDHKQTSRAHNGRTEEEAKFDSVMWGTGARLRQVSFGLINRQLGILSKSQTEAGAAEVAVA